MAFRPLKWFSHVLARKYILVRPSGPPPWDVIVAFHGFGGSPNGMRKRTHLDEVAEATNSAILYVKAPNRNWGGWLKWRANPKHLRYTNQVIRSGLNKLVSNRAVNYNRIGKIWFVGHSDGASFVVYYGAHRSVLTDFKVSGVICYAGLLWDRIETSSLNKYPLLIIRGVKDRLVKRENVMEIADYHRKLGHHVEFENATDGHSWQLEMNSTIVSFIERHQ